MKWVRGGGGRQLATFPLRHGAARSAVFPSCAAQLASDLRQSAPCEGTLSHVDATGPVVMHRAVDAACVCSPKYHLRDRPPGGTQIPPVRHSRACPPQHAVFSSSFRQHNEPGGSYTSSHVDATGPGVMHWAVDVVHPNTTSALVTPDSPPPNSQLFVPATGNSDPHHRVSGTSWGSDAAFSRTR